MRDELEDLRAAGREKDQVIADLRAKLEDENQTVLVLTRKLKILLDKRDQQAASPPLESANLQTIVEGLADRMAADPKSAFETYVDQRVRRISSWFDAKVLTLGNLISQRIADHKVLEGRLITLERKTDALESSENALIDELEGKTDRNTQDLNARISRLDQRLNDLQAKTHDNTVDLYALSARITKLEVNQ